MKRQVALAAGALWLAACGRLEGFGGPAPPLVSFQVTFSGDLGPLRPPGDAGETALSLALVWGDQWLTEPFCVPPAKSTEAAAVIAAGCRDPFGFVAASVAKSVPLVPGGTTSLTLEQLPSADVMVGDITARVAYGTLVVFDDRDGGGLNLSAPHRTPSRDRGPPSEDVPESADVIYGASFVTMTKPDLRVAYREGGPPTGAFYPRSGCPAPPPGFSIAGAGGFSAMAGHESAVAGTLPAEDDPAACSTAAPSATVVAIAARAPAEVEEVGCAERLTDSSTRYREPPADAPDLTGREHACAHLPTFDAGTQTGLMQLVVSGQASDRCKGLTHYTLRGCRENVSCAVPDWDLTASAPAWWPCTP